MNKYIEVYGEGDEARCTIRYEHDEMFQGDRNHARVASLSLANDVVRLLFGFPELQKKAHELVRSISDIETYPMPPVHNHD